MLRLQLLVGMRHREPSFTLGRPMSFPYLFGIRLNWVRCTPQAVKILNDFVACKVGRDLRRGVPFKGVLLVPGTIVGAIKDLQRLGLHLLLRDKGPTRSHNMVLKLRIHERWPWNWEIREHVPAILHAIAWYLDTDLPWFEEVLGHLRSASSVLVVEVVWKEAGRSLIGYVVGGCWNSHRLFSLFLRLFGSGRRQASLVLWIFILHFKIWNWNYLFKLTDVKIKRDTILNKN